MANAKSTLRQAENIVTLVGIVQEINLEKKTGENGNYITGTVSIKTGQNSIHRVSAFSNELVRSGENKGKVSSIYKGLETVMNEYTSIASLMKQGMSAEEAEQQATKVNIKNGNLRRNEYYTPNGELVSRFQISTNFFTRLNSDEKYIPTAEFAIEGYFSKMKEEVKNGEETGRLLVSMYVPQYDGSIIPMDFVAEGETADYLRDEYEVKKSGYIWGEIINTANVKTKEHKGFGKARVTTETTYRNELLITGGDPEQYDEDDKKSFDKQLIKQAVTIRETEYLPSLQERASNRDKKQGFSNKKTSPEVKKAVDEFDNDF